MKSIPTLALSAIRSLATVPCACLSLAAAAQQDPAAAEEAVRAFLEAQTRGLPGEVRISLQPFDARNQLPPCASLKPFLPARQRPWGDLSVGIQCESPITWTAYLQGRVEVWADYLVAAQPLKANQIVAPAHIGRQHGNLAALADTVLTDPSQAVGHHTRFAVAAGSPLRSDLLRVPSAVRQGQTVQVVSTGTGFRVSSEGRALNNAAPGEPVRVRMPNGQIVTGTAQAGGQVEVGL